MLPGTMRALVYAAAARLDLPVDARDLYRPELLAADEVFLTATSTLALPVLALDGAPIARGRCGPIVRAIAADLRDRLELE